MSAAFSKVSQRSSHSAVVASGAEMARSRSEARLAVPVAREPKTRTSRTAGNCRQAARNTARSLFRRATGFIILIPGKGLNPAGHRAEERGVIADHMLVDAGGQGFIVGLASEIAVVEHLEPHVGFLGRGNQPLGRGLFECWARAAAFVALPFQVELETLPDQFERELEPLDDGIAEDGGFRLRNGFLQPCNGIANLRLAFDESFFAHRLLFNMERSWPTTPYATAPACSRRRGRSAGAWGRRRLPCP